MLCKSGTDAVTSVSTSRIHLRLRASFSETSAILRGRSASANTRARPGRSGAVCAPLCSAIDGQSMCCHKWRGHAEKYVL